jgi:DNA replication protein DnaC
LRTSRYDEGVPCSQCDDTGWKTIDVDGVQRVTRCDCWRQAAAERLSQEAEIPPRYQNCDLDGFNDYNDSLSKAVGCAKRFVSAFPAVDRGLLFVGSPGLGKTHLAIACLRLAAHERGLRGVFHDTRLLLRRIRQTYDPAVRTIETDRQVIDPIASADLLVLDDIGAERATEWVEETLHFIVNTRYNERRATIFTTNYPLVAPPDAKHAETLLERIGFRMYSRLHEMCEFVELKGEDYRELGPRPSVAALARLDKKGSASHKGLPSPSSRSQARARLKQAEPAPDLKWSGGKAGN